MVTIVRVLPEGWLFRDAVCSDNEVGGLLGYVHEDETGFEAVWIAPIPASEHFDALEAVIRAAESRCASRYRPTGPRPVPPEVNRNISGSAVSTPGGVQRSTP
ncbi:hypothetical protein N1028_13540 [Herbiconiux sp. CPCC 203407]|uniref:Uncharacterized protein n=1 Tax=Herbiconiux oxytropis TaxID=2970915 RepID=A0AA41XJ15_9MICO|nr:hypothetical protein [Herbiconiux oxytropis]MCS5724147.1 hypothetical protein [Herbiconiux oxytropis]MCS5726918.1 hypothetical protein [Herbiconiux oxytropis]